MPFQLLDRPPQFVRQTALGSEAVYELLDTDGDLVTAAVVHAPGLAAGARVRLMGEAVRGMDRCDPPAPVADSRADEALAVATR